MAKMGPLLELVRSILSDGGTRIAGDEELLERFVDGRDQTAFEEIVRRHGSMVLEVCYAVLGNAASAEDVFQATFLVLVRQAGSIRKKAALAGWLHAVAYRAALRAKAQSARRRELETQAPEREAGDHDALTWGEVRQTVHEELGALSDRHREPLVICYLHGQTQDEAAAQLRLSKGRSRGGWSGAGSCCGSGWCGGASGPWEWRWFRPGRSRSRVRMCRRPGLNKRAKWHWECWKERQWIGPLQPRSPS